MGYWKLLDTASVEKDFEDDYNVIVQNAFGVGVPPHNNIATRYSLNDGALYQRTLIPPRVFTLQCATKTTTLDAWHTARKDLFQQLKRDRAGTISPVTIRYDDGTTTLDIEAYYDAGLEIGTLEKTIEKFAIRFICFDPFWKASSSSNTALTVNQLLSTELVVYRTTDGAWNTDADGIGVQLGAAIFAEKSNGDIVVAGQKGNIYVYNGSTFSDVGTITLNQQVYACVVDASDNIIIGGSFTDVDSVTARRIALYNGSAWSEPMTNGLDNTVWGLAVDHSGNYLAVGDFTQDATPAGTYRRAVSINPSTGSPTEIGSGFNSTVYGVAVSNAGDYYFTGLFTADGAGAGTYRRLAKWDGSTMTEVDGGLNSGGQSLVYDNDRNVFFVGGGFTTDGPGNKTLNRVAKIVNDITFDMNITVAPIRATMAIDPADGSVLWEDATDAQAHRLIGTTLTSEGIKITSATIASIFIDSTGRLWVSDDAVAANQWEAEKTTTVNNTGTAEAFPTITVTGDGSGPLYKISNYTASKFLYFNDLTLLDDEVLTINLSPGQKTVVSSLRGNLISKVQPPSDLTTFSLLPGNNEIGVWLDGGATTAATASIAWTAAYWSIDGVT